MEGARSIPPSTSRGRILAVLYPANRVRVYDSRVALSQVIRHGPIIARRPSSSPPLPRTRQRISSKPASRSWLRVRAKTVRRVCSICVGAFALAEAGLLDGRRATTHWAMANHLAERYPAVQVDPNPIWVKDGNLYTSAGISAGIDLALALVGEDLGNALALELAKGMVLFLRRPGGQAQFSVSLQSQ